MIATEIAFEKEGWRRLGVPLESLPDADKIIADKYPILAESNT